MISDTPLSNAPEWTVSDLAGALKRTIEEFFGHVRLRGEISGFRGQHSSGHAYFCLKDQNARLDAVIWKGTYSRLRIKPEEGLEVIATGRITTFPGKSTYQIVVESLEPAGIGALMALLEERRRKLTAEGPFRDRPQAPAALSAEGDRRGDLADRLGHPRHPSSARGPLPAPCPRLAGPGPGRDQCRRGGRGDSRVQRAEHRRRTSRGPTC